MTMEIRVLDDPAAACADLLVEAAEAGRHICLTGGGTPKDAYQRAASKGADWSGATLWWGDERCVDPGDELSNFAMAKKALLDPVGAPPPAFHRIRAETGPSAGADDYERELRSVLGEEMPRLDLMLLGLGPDAHVASLFPGQDTLEVRDRVAVGVQQAGHEPYVPRVSLTLPVLCDAEHIVFLVAGDGKAEAVARSFGSDVPDAQAPGRLVRPTNGKLTLLLDEAAASRLNSTA